MTVIKRSTGGGMIEPGVYRARLIKIEDEESSEYGPQIKFYFVVLDEDGEPTSQEILGWASAKFHPKSKLYTWARAMLRSKCPNPESDDLETEDLLNKRCDIEIVSYRKKDGSDGTKIGQLYPYNTMASSDAA